MIKEKLMKIQSNLVAPKSQFNNFGKYSYRSCEDILEALKPLLKENGCILTISDEIQNIGARFYIKATATLTDIENEESVSVSAYAREEENKKGMDGSQVTGASSSYARKYALNGLFCIDDNKDSDTTNTEVKKLSEAQVKRMYAIGSKAGYGAEQINQMVNKKYNKKPELLTKEEYDHICTSLENVAK